MSPQRRTSAPPISLVFPLMSLRFMSRASRGFLWAIVHSSRSINLDTLNTNACPLVFFMLQEGFCSLATSSGKFRAEKGVLLPSIRVDSMPKETMARATFQRARISARTRLIKNILPLPQGHQGI
ncbi:hypothetical protein AVEN_201740-1 [Araneus ventricosus]|uniref:Uncharacterized protein n=1 Tax=Araneus ventricosus TaxID=182803 RepID=A0A4Y2PN17_ARAVE|nr:hypothetical protein AVEN_201740-1 [Araneus ventricosus]